MSIYALKGRFQALLRPLVRALHGAGAGATANQITVIAAPISLLVAAIVYVRAPGLPLLYLLLPVWMLVRMGLNAIDGMLAREFKQQSRLGAYLNELCDVVADAALYLALLRVPGRAQWARGAVAGRAAVGVGQAVRPPPRGAAALAIEDRRRPGGRRRVSHAARRRTVVDHAVRAVAGGPAGAGNQPDGLLRRAGDVGDQARPRHQGLGPHDRRPGRHARPAGSGVLRRAGVLPRHPLLVGLAPRA
ncbi:hypothetical protein J2W68_002975 [Luteimonas terrae]|uniref:CDP-alcohol phosphatidyltransferase family protein n=1 Tax=Luteimonas terrae TaxID=1530191 RepID=A0ABU1Y054_9GAMM|nr:hypothetical protein [Luteimonas terrae]